MSMVTSKAGLAAIRRREGCRLTAYRDTVGVWTIGVGHTGRASPPLVVPGMTITLEQADILLSDDLASFEVAINRAVTVPMSQNQFDACASLAFNIGAGAFARSTVVRKLNQGDIPGAADAFLLWDKPQELRQRRIGERAQFLAKDTPLVNEAPVIATRPAAPPPKPVKPSRAAAAGTAAAGALVAAGVAAHPELRGFLWGALAVSVAALAAFLFIHFRKH